jgi:hypothetical protein
MTPAPIHKSASLSPAWRTGIAIAGAAVFCTVLYKYTFRAWFQADDFAWLGLRLQVHSWPDFWRAMFVPLAGGSVRPLTDRAFFLAFSTLFGIHALPYRIAIYVFQLSAIVLLGVVAQRLCKSYWAAFIVPALWVANSALAGPLTWTCAFNEIVCAGVFLLAFYFLMRFVETGDWRFNAWQWIVFLLGFGILEITVTYPLIAMLYAACFARRYFKHSTLLLIPSAIFTLVFFATRIKPRNESFYALNANASVFRTLASYWNIAMGPRAAAEYFPRLEFMVVPATLLLSIAVLTFTAWRARRGDRIPVFCLGWFLFALATFLPIAHLTDYYLTVPAIGLALLGGWAVVLSLESKMIYRAATWIAIAIYLAFQIPAARASSKQWWARSMPVKRLVLDVQTAYMRNPGKTILLDGVDEPLFWLGVYNHPFRLFGATNVYLTTANAQRITPHPELADIADYTLPEAEMRSEVAQGKALVYGVEDGRIHDITKVFQQAAVDAVLPRRIEVGHPAMESLLGTTWYPSEGDFRWMPREASVRLGAPENGHGTVHVEAFCAPVQVAAQPIVAWLTLDGHDSPRQTFRDCNQPVILETTFRTTPGTKEIDLEIHVDHTVRVGVDQRDLGLAVRAVEVIGAQ